MSAPKDMFFESDVRPEQNGRLLLDSLSERFTYHSREEWSEKISRGLVTINGNPATLETLGYRGDKVIYHVENYSEPDVPTHYETLFEDEEFLLVAKPAGVPVHHTGRIFYNTFTAIIRRGFDCETATPMHRLDRDTGGIMLFAKSADTASRFQKHLDRILLRKFYLAVVPGEFPEGEVRCDLPLSENPSAPIRIKMYHTPGGKPCSTVFRRLAVSPGAAPKSVSSETAVENSCRSLVECELLTGRKHQIRAHLAELGFPIVGDRLYSFDGKFYQKMSGGGSLSEEDFDLLGARHQMLYAYKVQLQLPYWDEPRVFMDFHFPEDMATALKTVDFTTAGSQPL
ncbi:pseudouridine synthase [Fibrobacter sp.]|uniref:pseudouridine synthase n=1 Tax=Fibrobacter sp. TaxID=35828 RepID=UPI00388D0F0C